MIAATYSENGIFSGTESDSGVALEGVQAGPDGLDIHYDRVGPDYFRAVGVPLLAGRDLGAGDRGGTARVAVVNEALAKRYFPGRSPLGRRLTMLGPPKPNWCDTRFAMNARRVPLSVYGVGSTGPCRRWLRLSLSSA